MRSTLRILRAKILGACSGSLRSCQLETGGVYYFTPKKGRSGLLCGFSLNRYYLDDKPFVNNHFGY